MGDEKSIHAGHRKRMKSAMLEAGLDGLNSHQIIEMLLFYAIPKVDTNPIAHELVNRFGNLRGVLEADYNELVQVKGIGENAASLIKFAQLLSGRYLRDSCFDDGVMCVSDTEALKRYFEGAFLGVKNEQIRAMVIDDNLCMLKESIIVEGTIDKVEFNSRKFIDFVVKNDCNRVVIAHNHPMGNAVPSKADVDATISLLKTLKVCDIELMDHIIVAKTGSLSMHSFKHGFGIWIENNE